MLGLVGESFQKHVPEVAGLPIIGLSALTGAGAEKLMPAVLSAYELWTQRVPTSRLNSWLAKVWGNACSTNHRLLDPLCGNQAAHTISSRMLG